MRWGRIIGLTWFLLIPIALGLNLWLQRLARRRDMQKDRVLRRIDAFLTVWATHWGEPPEAVKPKLMEILEGRKSGGEQ